MDRKKKIVEKVSPSEKEKLLHELAPYLSSGRFVNVATCSFERMPNVSPKLVVKAHKNILFLVDHVIGRTYINLKNNPRVSVSFVDDKTLTGYQLNGTVDILESGEEFDKLAYEFQEIKTKFTVERILLNLRTGEKASPLEFSLPEKFVVLKIKVIEIVEISSSGGKKSKLAF